MFKKVWIKPCFKDYFITKTITEKKTITFLLLIITNYGKSCFFLHYFFMVPSFKYYRLFYLRRFWPTIKRTSRPVWRSRRLNKKRFKKIQRTVQRFIKQEFVFCILKGVKFKSFIKKKEKKNNTKKRQQKKIQKKEILRKNQKKQEQIFLFSLFINFFHLFFYQS